ncbi:mpv17-like protein 2 [Uranotaenia lowii]|uniref:mpv17-like protein 2 n=1 Tax=Uranotaenia lowii TaxID=190385 RepID=UPI0024792D9D|nr:mpv17-like protein 2 [Uranotaenia lowii]XP_055586640.1 mpv17-like protein 2 [Uranotaenia lowii]
MKRVLIHLRTWSRKAFSSKFLLYTNVGISLTLSGVGDIIEQHYEIYSGDMETWDRKRTRQMSISGFTVGIFCHHWYNFMDRRFPGRTVQTVLKKVLIDQTVASPINILIFFITLGFLRSASVDEAYREMSEKFVRLYTAEWVVWPPAQLINFYLLPTKYRVLYDNTISLGYDVYTSHVINHGSEAKS